MFFTTYVGKVLVMEPIEPAEVGGMLATTASIGSDDCGEVNDPSLPQIKAAKDTAIARNITCTVKIKVSATHVRMETLEANESLSIRFKRSIRDIVRVDRIDPVRVALTFTPESERSDRPDKITIVFGKALPPPEEGHIVQFFHMPTEVEAGALYNSVAAGLEKSEAWSGSVSDLTQIGLD